MLKTKTEHITYWANQSKDDLEATELLLAGKKYLQALYFTHLSLEKICKSCWIIHNEGNIPPKTHNLIFLLSQTTIELTTRQKEFLLELNRFQIEGRYPEQISALYKTTSASTAKLIIDEAKELHRWLLNKLQ